MEKPNEFPHEVIGELKYYVYRLIDPRNGETFYVGKGNGNRVFQHVKRALIDADRYSLKYERIRDIDRAGLDVLHIIHRHGMDEDTAIHVEAALIDAFPGLSNLQNGTGNNEYGQMHAQEIIHKYGLPEAHFQHRIMMINVNWTLGERELYDAVRFAWKVNIDKARRAEYIVGVVHGIIKGVFVADTWLPALKANFPILPEDMPTRIGFNGTDAPAHIQQLYLHTRIPAHYRKKGAANPVKYTY